jgi:NAD(P)-dependent dehydrogenase (short-subunit alcohol dehydrogenase family)
LLARHAIGLATHEGARRRGRIIIGALAAQQPFSAAALGGYSASKAGIEAITRSTALEVAALGIAVNCVAPGPIGTPMAATMSDRARADIQSRVPMRRIGKPEEVASHVGFLASEQCGFVTGQVVYIDGGLSIGALHGTGRLNWLTPNTPIEVWETLRADRLQCP